MRNIFIRISNLSGFGAVKSALQIVRGDVRGCLAPVYLPARHQRCLKHQMTWQSTHRMTRPTGIHAIAARLAARHVR
jgi:hypothetical protein